MARLPTTRTCDGCDLCCTAVGVGDLKKAPAVRCPHLTGDPAGHNCGLYPDHPRDCQEFVCLWRGSDKALPDALQPAKCGFVIAFNGMGMWPLLFTVHPDPARPKAWNTLANRTLFKAMAGRLNSMVVVGQAELATHVFAPSGKVFKKTEHPEFFIDGGVQVGVPQNEFRLWRPGPKEIGAALFEGGFL